MFDNISKGLQVQQKLSELQAISALGPLVISPVKAVVSIAEIVAGIALAILCSIPALLIPHPWFMEKVEECTAHAGLGLISLVYSILNMVTLGIVGHRLQSSRAFSI